MSSTYDFPSEREIQPTTPAQGAPTLKQIDAACQKMVAGWAAMDDRDRHGWRSEAKQWAYALGLYAAQPPAAPVETDADLPTAEDVRGILGPPPERCSAGRESERSAFIKAYPHLDLTEVPDAWGRPMFKHSHVQALWDGWFARSVLIDPPQPLGKPDIVREALERIANTPSACAGRRMQEIARDALALSRPEHS